MQLHLVVTLIVLTAVSIAQGFLTARLSELDYGVNEDSPSLTVTVTSEGSHDDPITLQIIPLTFSMYQMQFPNMCELSVEQYQQDDDAAESSDFNTTISETVLEPSMLGTRMDTVFNIPLISDSIIEGTEAFLLLLNVISTENVRIERRCAAARLRGALPVDQEVIRLEPQLDHLMLQEHAGTVFLFNITKLVESELTIDIKIEIRSIGGQEQGNDSAVIPSTTLVIPPETSVVPVSMVIFDDLFAEDSETNELRLTASIKRTPISQQFISQFTIIDNDVVALGFVGEEERTVVEGNEVRICADLKNFTTGDFLRFNEFYILSTKDETATAGEDYTALGAPGNTYLTLVGLHCFNLQTTDNNHTDELRSFTVNFPESGLTRSNLTVIEPSSVRVVIMDNDAPPQAPMIASVTSDKTLTVIWTAEPTPTKPIDRFIVIITIGNRSQEFKIDNSTIRTHTLEDYRDDKTHVIVICAENMNGRSCSPPYTSNKVKVPVIITTGGLSESTKVSPGLIGGIAVIVAVLLCFCLLLLFLCLCICWKVDREKSYWPAKSEAKQIRGRSPDSNYSEDDDYSYESDLHKAPL